MKKEKDLNYLSYSEAIADALFLSMKKNKDVFIYGQGVDDPKGHYGTTKNFHKIFGPHIQLIASVIKSFEFKNLTMI